ncbi:hypothetical protein KIW84_053374 [Lathyrus oleraceus]|uniref:Uncharacterized protein n=1 Tax=Pisum sativum TaxID=3888 RepID=A0A9D5AD84_PEA|nr:hypothetical protein KIW84_053374 [Pisum sativum]
MLTFCNYSHAFRIGDDPLLAYLSNSPSLLSRSRCNLLHEEVISNLNSPSFLQDISLPVAEDLVPILFTQHPMHGFMSATFGSEDLQCSFFQYTVRELLAYPFATGIELASLKNNGPSRNAETPAERNASDDLVRDSLLSTDTRPSLT